MRKWYCGGQRALGQRALGQRALGQRALGLLALGGLALAGCAEQPAAIDPAEAMALLRTGRPVLGCREPCLAEWQQAQPQAAQLAAGRRSQELAMLVMRIGYQDDLSLYYLGRAAEGMGYRGAATSYYRQSMQLSGTAISCQHLSRQCGGVVLPLAASSRVAAIERALNRPAPRRAGAAPAGPQTSGAAPGEVGPPAPEEAEAPAPGPPVASPAARPAASPVSSPGGPAAFEYIEPPPATR